jgi:hypothetical protein
MSSDPKQKIESNQNFKGLLTKVMVILVIPVTLSVRVGAKVIEVRVLKSVMLHGGKRLVLEM